MSQQKKERNAVIYEVVRTRKEKGLSLDEIAKMFGLRARSTVYAIWKREDEKRSKNKIRS